MLFDNRCFLRKGTLALVLLGTFGAAAVEAVKDSLGGSDLLASSQGTGNGGGAVHSTGSPVP